MLLNLKNNIAAVYFFVFFLICGIYFFIVDQSLVYHFSQPFFTGQVNWGEAFSKPGYFSSFISSFVFQFFFSNFLGSLILTFLLFIWCLSVFYIYKRNCKTQLLLLFTFASALPIISAHSHYSYPDQTTISFIIGALSGLLYKKTLRNSNYINLVISITLSILVYIISGSAGLLVFIAITASIFLIKKSYNYIPVQIIIGLIIPVLFSFVSNTLPVRFAFLGNFQCAFYFEMPNIVFLIPVILISIGLTPEIEKLIDDFKIKIWIVESIIPTIIIALLFFTVYNSYQEKQKKLISLNKLDYEQNWDKVIETADSNIALELYPRFYLNRALYHKGLLLEKLFDCPQTQETDGLIINRAVEGAIAIHNSDIYYDMGFLNESIHWANEAYMIFGDGPRILERLADVYIASKQYGVAEKFVNKLERSVITRKKALKFKKLLHCDSCVNSYPEYGLFNKYDTTLSFYASLKNPILPIIELYNGNLYNKMAFEYMIAMFLIERDFNDPSLLFGQLRRFGYEKMPRVCQEAYIIYLSQKGLPANKNIIDPEVIDNFFRVYNIIRKHKNKDIEAKKAMEPYKNTFWYYLFFE